MKRRDFLMAAAVTVPLTTIEGQAAFQSGRELTAWQTNALGYLESLRRSDGGYAWPDQPRSHLTPSFAAAGCYHVLDQTAPRKEMLTAFVREHHPFQIKKLERELKYFEYQQIQSLQWLGEPVSSFEDQVRGWTRPSAYTKAYEGHGYPVLQIEAMALICRGLLGLMIDDVAPAFAEYFDVRRRANGSFNNTPANDGSDGHVMNTWWALQGLAVLGRSLEKRDNVVAWVQSCQLAEGGFTYQPNPEFAGVADATYTWAAVRILDLLDSRPSRREACLEYLGSLRNPDGGSADRPGWPSNATATYRVLDTLRALGGLDHLQTPASRRPSRRRPLLPANLNVFTIQIEAHGKGSPAEAVDLARALRIHLWGAKNAEPGWIDRAQAIADREKTPVKFFVSNEEYGAFVSLPGMGTYSHTSDIIAPAGVEFGSSLAGEPPVDWDEYRHRRLAPLQQHGGRLIWQFNENEELTRLYLDDSLERGGYAAISSFHFGNPDFTNSEPFLKHYSQQIPFIALQDAHGNEPWWWADQLTGFRTLFLAAEPTWDGWLEALRKNWVVAVRRDAVSRDEIWMHGGAPEAVELITQRELQWRWWDNPRVQRPLVSIVAVKPEDRWEAARPEKGAMIRVRCQWNNTVKGLPKIPRVELVRLIVDGRTVEPTLFAPPAQWGAYHDYYHHYHLDDPAPGGHTAAVTVRDLASKIESDLILEFTV